jgi:DedD protein
MREPNARVRPRESGKLELSLDGKAVASVVVVALVLLAVVFVLGLNVGKQIALRQAERRPAGDLEALDRAPTPPPPVKDEALTFHERLTKEQPAAAAGPPADSTPTPTSAPAAATPTPAPAPSAAPSATATPPSTATPPAPRTVTVPAPAPRPVKPWTIQLAAAQDKAEAERVASRFASLNPRIEQADVPGKGRFWRVRVGGFDTKDAAERYLRDVGRETGAKGFVAPAR